MNGGWGGTLPERPVKKKRKKSGPSQWVAEDASDGDGKQYNLRNFLFVLFMI